MPRRIRFLLVAALGAALLGGVILAACQSHELDQVTPKAIVAVKSEKVFEGLQLPAKVMLVVDKSGSMKSKVDSGDWGCCQDVGGGGCGGYTKSGSCKWNNLIGVLGERGGLLLPASTTDNPVARFGLAVFPAPSSDGCDVGEVLEEVGSTADTATTNRILTHLNSEIIPNGGTPSAKTLQALLGNEAFMKEEASTRRFVILLTDGLPNCNDALGAPGQPACTACTSLGRDPDQLCAVGGRSDPGNCLDDVQLVEAIASLKTKGVDTIVIGVGKDTTNPLALDVLNRAAVAGGQPQSGSLKYFQVSTPEEFQPVLLKIRSIITPCEIGLPRAPTNLSLFEVDLNDLKNNIRTQLVKDVDWEFKSGSSDATVVLKGQRCSDLQNAEPGRYKIEFFDVESL